MNRQAIAQTQHGMSVAEGAMWWLILIPFSGGLLFPAYLGRRHKLNRTYTTYS
jgi:hypothetical protein